MSSKSSAERHGHHLLSRWIEDLGSDIRNLKPYFPKEQEVRTFAKLREALLPIPHLLEKRVELLFKQRKLGLMRPDRMCTLEVALLDDVMILDEAIMVQPEFLLQVDKVVSLFQGTRSDVLLI